MKYKINWIGEKKDITTKFGVKQKFSIKVEGNNEFLGVWANPQNANWAKGQEIEGNITTSAGRDGKIFYNFEMPKKDDVMMGHLINFEGRLKKLENWVAKQEDTKTRGYEYPEEPKTPPNFEPDEIDISDIPFN